MPKTVFFLTLSVIFFGLSCKTSVCECDDGGFITTFEAKFPSREGVEDDCKAKDKELEIVGGSCSFYTK